MTTRVRLPDGSHVNVPTDDPQAAAAAARKHWQARQPAKPKTFLDKVDGAFDTAADFVDDAVDNLLPNWGDELRGAGRAARAVVSGEDPRAAFREGQRSFKRDQARYDREHPKLATASTVVGTGAGVALPAGKALKGANMVQKARQGATVGAAYGALSGAGKGEGADIGRRASNAATSAIPGAIVGASLPGVAQGAVGAGRWARGHVPGVDRAASALARVPAAITRRVRGPQPARPEPAERQANRMLSQRMNAGTIADGQARNGPPATPALIAQEVAQRNQRGVPAMVGDVTEPMRELTEWSSRGMGPAQTMVRQRLDARKAQEASRVRQHVQDTLPSTEDPIRFVEEATRRARAEAAPMYQAAYGQPMYVTPPIDAITQTPAFRNALPQAYDNIRNQIDDVTGLPKDPTAMGFRYFEGEPGSLPGNLPYFSLPERGHVRLDPNSLSTEGFDQVVRAMNDSGRAASHVNPVTGRVESTTNSVHINNRAQELRQLLRDQNEYYDQAVGRYGDEMSHISGFNQGRDVGKLTGHEINAQRRSLPEAAHETWSTGAGTALADEASRYGSQYPNGATANHIRKQLGDDVKQGAVSDMTGNSGGVRELLDRMEFENQGHINWQGVNGNSRTASRQALDQDLDAMTGSRGIPMTREAVLSRLVNFVSNRAAPQFQQDVKQRIADVVTASDARTVQDVMRAVADQAERDREFADLLHKSGVAATAAYGMNLYPEDQPQEP